MRAKMADGVNAIVTEFEAHGTDEDKRTLRRVLDQAEMPEDMHNPGWQPVHSRESNPLLGCLP